MQGRGHWYCLGTKLIKTMDLVTPSSGQKAHKKDVHPILRLTNNKSSLSLQSYGRCGPQGPSIVLNGKIELSSCPLSAGELLGDYPAAEPSHEPQQEAGEEGAELDPMAAFKAEITALEGMEGAMPEGEERVETPEPEDRRFEDDDGTIYVWDPALRKFVEEGTQPSGAGYNVEDMVFEMDEEIIPEYKPPRVRTRAQPRFFFSRFPTVMSSCEPVFPAVFPQPCHVPFA
jgi:hypothetical protein